MTRRLIGGILPLMLAEIQSWIQIGRYVYGLGFYVGD